LVQTFGLASSVPYKLERVNPIFRNFDSKLELTMHIQQNWTQLN